MIQTHTDDQPLRILLVEDSDDDAVLLGRQLAAAGPVHIERVEEAAQMAEALDRQAWDVVISDYSMPQFDGLAALRLVRERTNDMPFILVSSTVPQDVAIGAMSNGANDFVMKDELARLAPALRRELRGVGVRRAKQAAETAVEELRAKLAFLDGHDALTGLANRKLFLTRIAESLGQMRLVDGKLPVVAIDLEKFASLQATLGRAAGDELLVQASARLARCVAKGDHVARVGAGRFALLLEQSHREADIARRIRGVMSAAFEAPFDLNGNAVRVQARAGIATCPDDGVLPEPLLAHAELAVARCAGTADGHLFYTRQMTHRLAEQLDLENRLSRAIANDEFTLHYQPKVDLRDDSIAGVEALLRWTSPDLGAVSPDRFIPVLEDTGLIAEVGAWVLQRAARDQLSWAAVHARAPRIAVNVSALQLDRADFLDVLSASLKDGARLDLEVTESSVVRDVDAAIAMLKGAAGLGSRIAIDDFGTGYSSLAYLSRLPVHAIKIDRSFVAALGHDAAARSLVESIIAMARLLNLETIAEGVETAAQARCLREIGCNQGQGYLIGRPMPASAMEELIRTRH